MAIRIVRLGSEFVARLTVRVPAPLGRHASNIPRARSCDFPHNRRGKIRFPSLISVFSVFSVIPDLESFPV
jgi:hypothetical protein